MDMGNVITDNLKLYVVKESVYKDRPDKPSNVVFITLHKELAERYVEGMIKRDQCIDVVRYFNIETCKAINSKDNVDRMIKSPMAFNVEVSSIKDVNSFDLELRTAYYTIPNVKNPELVLEASNHYGTTKLYLDFVIPVEIPYTPYRIIEKKATDLTVDMLEKFEDTHNISIEDLANFSFEHEMLLNLKSAGAEVLTGTTLVIAKYAFKDYTPIINEILAKRIRDDAENG